MTDRLSLSAEYQIKQSRKVKVLEAENGRLRAEVAALKVKMERRWDALRDAQLDAIATAKVAYQQGFEAGKKSCVG